MFELVLGQGESGSADPMDAAIDRRDRAGSYHELDLAISGLSKHVNKPLRFAALTVWATEARRLLDDVYLPPRRPLEGLSRWERELLDLAVEYIESRMPDPIRVPVDVRANETLLAHRPVWPKGRALTALERSRRDAQIRLWARDGRPFPWIAQQAGLSDRQLREIINGRSA